MKKLILTAAAIIAFQASFSQQVIWEKTYGWQLTDKVNTIEPIDNGCYFAGGTSMNFTYYSRNYQGPSLVGAMLLKINSVGDTLWCKYLGCMGYIRALKMHPDGNLFVSVAVRDTNELYKPIRLYKVTPEGEYITSWDYPEVSNGYVNDMLILPDGGALMVGHMYSTTGGITDGFALRVDLNGRKVWMRHYTPSLQTYINHIEALTDNSGYLISGMAGYKIFADWITEDGDVFDQKFYWNNSANNDLYFAGVMQSPDSTFIAWGSNTAEPERKWTVGKYLRDGTRVWQNEVTGACQTVFVNTDAEILVSFDDASGIYFRKYSRDNTIIKTAIIGTVTRTPKIIFAAAWNYDNTAVFTGYNKVDSNVERENFWFCKIAEVGNPYLSVEKPLMAEREDLIIYPNPAKDAFSLNSRVPGTLVIYSLSGQVLQTQAYLPGDKTDISLLASGLYMYKFSSGKGLSTGKLVKE